MNKILYFLIIFLLNLSLSQAEPVRDEIADALPKTESKIETYLNYNFQSTTKIPIKLKIIEPIKSEKYIYEGQIVEFKVARDCIYNNKLLFEKGIKVQAKISTIITSGMNGIPASIIFSDFEINDIPKNKLSNSLEVFGQDRSLWVFPLKWALTFLPPTGSLTNFIKGGHAKLNSEKIITIYYYPEWN